MTSLAEVVRYEVSSRRAASRRLRPSRRIAVPVASAADSPDSTNVARMMATSWTACGWSTTAPRGRLLTAWKTTPARTADSAMAEWLASVPYHGTSRSSRASSVETMATQPPATGPPSAVAAMMNGRWKVRTPWPWSCSTRVPPSRPSRIQNSTPSRIPSDPPACVREIVGQIVEGERRPGQGRQTGDDGRRRYRRTGPAWNGGCAAEARRRLGTSGPFDGPSRQPTADSDPSGGTPGDRERQRPRAGRCGAVLVVTWRPRGGRADPIRSTVPWWHPP